MPCYQSTSLPSGFTTTGRTSYKTEAECLQACKEGACCEGTTCTVKPQCQCQGAGQVFKGVGTTCGTVACCNCTRFGELPCMAFGIPAQFKVTISDAWLPAMNGEYSVLWRPYLSDYPTHGLTAITVYTTGDLRSDPETYLNISLTMHCASSNSSLRYFYSVVIRDDYLSTVVFPTETLSGNYFLDGTQPCQGQTLTYDPYFTGRSYTAVVECISNPLP